MNRTTALRIGIATAVAAAGLTVGGVALASADDDPDDTTSQQSSPGEADRRGHGPFGDGPGSHGPGGHGPFGYGPPGHVTGGQGLGGPHLADLAGALGVDEDELREAFAAVREDLRHHGRPQNGEKPDREERRDAIVAALAEELGLSEGDVSSALEDLAAEKRAERRAELAERLDDAVAEGDLTDDDAASVLKAFDAGVLGGGPLH